MCFTKPKTPQPGAQPAAPAAQGADSLVLGGSDTEDERLRNAGVLGRLALRVGNFAGRIAGPGGSDTSGSSTAPSTGGGGAASTGGGTGGTGGGSTAGGGSASGGFSGYGVGGGGGGDRTGAVREL
jgi:hypothetical protein